MTSDTPSKFDVFLCHNSKEKSEVKKIAHELQARGLTPWLDEWELRPGFSWQELLEEQIESIHSAAVFIGSSGIGPWQNRELRAFLNEFVGRGCPVIPVLLATAPQQPELPIFLRAMTWVDFRRADPDPMGRLVWGITGEKPKIPEVLPKLSAKEFFDRGNAKKNSGDNQGAIADFDRMIQLRPDDATAYIIRGKAKFDSGDKQGAIADFDRAIQLRPDLAEAYAGRGLVKFDSGDKQGALANYDCAIQLDLDFAEAYTCRGLVKFDSGDKQGAITDFDRAIQLKPDYATAYYNRGNAKYNSGDYQGAIADYDRAIQLKPDYATAYYNRGLAKKNLGKKQEAIADLKQAAQLYKQQGKMNDCQDALDRIKELER